jgi:hypothetical protein
MPLSTAATTVAFRRTVQRLVSGGGNVICHIRREFPLVRQLVARVDDHHVGAN